MAKPTQNLQNSPEDFGTPLLSTEEFLAKRKWNEAQLSRAIQSSKIFVVRRDGIDQIPGFLAEELLIRAGVEDVCKVLAPLGAGSKLQFFTTMKASLNSRTPLRCLVDGELPAVLVAAEGFVER